MTGYKILFLSDKDVSIKSPPSGSLKWKSLGDSLGHEMSMLKQEILQYFDDLDRWMIMVPT